MRSITASSGMGSLVLLLVAGVVANCGGGGDQTSGYYPNGGSGGAQQAGGEDTPDECADGIDNDNDGKIDCVDAECCSAFYTTLCSKSASCQGTGGVGGGSSSGSSSGMMDPGGHDSPGTDVDGDGWAVEWGDCNDQNPNINPGAPEINNGIDDNCNGLIDEQTGGSVPPEVMTLLVAGTDYCYATGFGFPIGSGATYTECPKNDDGWYVDQDFHAKLMCSQGTSLEHLGEDWNAESGNDLGAPVRSVADGVVVMVRQATTSFGDVIVVRHDATPGAEFKLPSGGNAPFVYSMYAHLQNMMVTDDAIVTRGQQLAEIGDVVPGSTAPHLHFALGTPATPSFPGRGYASTTDGFVDPSDFLTANASVNPICGGGSQPCCTDPCTPTFQCDNGFVCDQSTKMCLPLGPTCGGATCNQPPNNQCFNSIGTCANGNCVYSTRPAGTTCNDGSSCTVGDTCDGDGNCVSGQVQCNAPPNVQCFESMGNCVAGTCQYVVKAPGTPCSDSNPCTSGDACNAVGNCVGAVMQCTMPPNALCYDTIGMCAGGTCFYTPKTAGTSCDDNNTCTIGDACNGAGVCAGNGMQCTTPPNQCYDAAGSCGNGMCNYNPKAAGTTCNDGDACTSPDVCNGSGTCSGTPKQCNTPPSQCYEAAGACNNGICNYNFKAAGTPCDDSNPCTTSDTCNGAGTCTGANPVVCTAQDECHTAGVCNTATGVCTNPSKPNGVACNDGNACTQTDTCQAGTCTGANPVVCTAQDQCHDIGTCNVSTGVCSNPPKPNGSACSDGNPCTTSDTCNGAGTCTGANPVVCTAQDQCHDVGTCNVATGVCSNPPKPNGSACSDGNACTQMDTCQAGTCTGANPVMCTAQDQCHDIGTCNVATGICSNPPKASGTSCNDNNTCTLNDMCNGAGTCSGTPMQCNSPPGQCYNSTGTCSGGSCSYSYKSFGSSCNDGDSCTTSDICDGSGSCSGTQMQCNSPPGQCYNSTGTCSGGSCSYSYKSNGSSCNDSNSCTSPDVCNGFGTCSGTAIKSTSASLTLSPLCDSNGNNCFFTSSFTPNLSCSCTTANTLCHMLYRGAVVSIASDQWHANLAFRRADGATINAGIQYWIVVAGVSQADCNQLNSYVVRVGPLTVGTSTNVLFVNNVPLWPSQAAYDADPAGTTKNIYLITDGSTTPGTKTWFQRDPLTFTKNCP